MVALVGEAGIGKTRLAREAADAAAAAGRRVLWGRCVASTAPVAYRPLVEALSAGVRAGTVVDDAGLGPFRPVLGRLVPAWRSDAAPGEGDAPVLALAEGLLRLLRSGPGTVLVVEDLHWADPETLTIVEYLADHLEPEPVLGLVTVRDEEPSPGLDLVRGLHARRASALFPLPRLDDGSVAELVEARTGAPPSPELLAVAARAEGVPFLVEELLAVADGSGAVVPLTFADSVRRRVAALDDPTRRVLDAAAVLGRRFDWALLAEVAEVDEGAVAAALRAGTEVQLLDRDPEDGTVRFRHALSRDAVLADLLPPDRVRLSGRALAAVERAHPDLPGAWCELAAGLAEGAGARERAAALLVEAGTRTADDGALASAEAVLERARTVVPADGAGRVDADQALLAVLALAGKHERATVVGEELLGWLGDAPTEASRRADAHLHLARSAVAGALWEEADAHLAHVADELAAVPDPARRARIDVLAAQVAILRHPAAAAAQAERALGVAESLGLADVACEALEVIGRHERARDLDAAAAAFSRARDRAVTAGREVWRLRAEHELGTVDLLRDGEVERLLAARAQAEGLGAVAAVAVVDVQVGAALCLQDDPEPAGAVCRRAAALAGRYRLSQVLAAARAFEGVVHARAGRREDAERCVAAATAAGGGHPEAAFNAGFAGAHLAWLDEDRRAAVAALADVTAGVASAVGVQATGPNAGLLALLLAVEGDASASGWVAEAPVHFLGRAWARYGEAVLVGRAGDLDAAVAAVAEADALLAGHAWYRHVGRRHLAEAAIADGWGDPVAWLTEALSHLAAHEADARIASACRSLLRRAGAPVPRRRGDAAGDPRLDALGVTAREAEVLALLAEGLTNRAMAERLFLSTRTVERHVGSLANKLGVDGRSALVARAVRLTGDGP